jgi:hypothetical protein
MRRPHAQAETAKAGEGVRGHRVSPYRKIERPGGANTGRALQWNSLFRQAATLFGAFLRRQFKETLVLAVILALAAVAV